jgi:hypothetical protein
MGKAILEASDTNVLKVGNIIIPFEIQDESKDTVLKASILFYISERVK